MHRYDWEWNRGYGWPRHGGSYGRDFQAPWWWEAQGPRGYDRGEGWPWRHDEFSGGDRWRERWAEGWERPRRGGYHGYGYGYERPPVRDWGWDYGPYDRLRTPFDDDPDTEFAEDYDDDYDELPWESGSGGGSMAPLDDAEIRRRVWRNLTDDGFIDTGSIQLEVQDRVVTLRGEVGDYMEARYAWDDAWEAQGVRGVVSKLEIRGEAREEAPAGAAKKAPRSGKSKASGSRSNKGGGE